LPKYNSIDTIPAKTFFTILSTKNWQLLKPKPREKGLESVFIAIYDEFFLKSDNPESNRYLTLTKQIAGLENKIAILKQALHFYYYNKTTKEMRMDFVKALKTGYDIEIDTEKPFIEEVHRVLTIEIGVIQNELTFAKAEYENATKKSIQKAFDYEENIVAIEGVVNRQIKDGIMLDKYVAYVKQAEKISAKQEENANKMRNGKR